MTSTTRRRRSDGELTWRRVLQAAVDCILETGYYQASSNEIARRAGVTWGTIQHLFGTREGLLLAVLNDRWVDMEHRIGTAIVSGDSLEDRISSVFDVLAAHYGRREHLVQLQILMDLNANPKVTKETREAVAAHGEALVNAWQPLFLSALGEPGREPDLVRFTFLTLRSFLIGNLIASHIAHVSDDTVTQQMLISSVARTISAAADERGLAVA